MPARLDDAMRIVLASLNPEGFALLHSTCEAAGHTPIAYVCSRSARPRQPADPYAAVTVSRLLGRLPPGVDLLLPADPEGLGQALAGYRADLLVIYGFHWILPPSVLRSLRFGAINVHPSKLPRYRGMAPVHWAIRNGDPEIGVTVHRLDAGVDTGPILAQVDGIPLDDDVTQENVRSRLAPAVREALATALERVVAGDQGEPQRGDAGPRAGWFEPGFSVVDWSQPARSIHNQVRVFRYLRHQAAPLARVDGRWTRLVRTSLSAADGVRVECGDGPIWIVESAPAEPPQLGTEGSLVAR